MILVVHHIILVTDGDNYAQETVEHVAQELRCGCIFRSAGNPTPLTGEEWLW